MNPLSKIIWDKLEGSEPAGATQSGKGNNKMDNSGGVAVIEAPGEIQPLDILRSEVNLLNLPFFALWDKDLRRRRKVEFTDVEERDGTKLQILWRVTGDSELGYPGPLDRKVFRAIEHIITSQMPPLENPVRLGSFAEIAKLLDFKKRKGSYDKWVYKRIKESIQRISATRAFSKGSWTRRSKEPDGKIIKRYLEDGPFSIYARPFFAWEELPNGTIADTNYLELGSWYLESLNARYVRPLDYNYYKSFKTNIGPRLYELLGTKFYGWKRGQAPRRFRYSTLTQLLPATKQRYLAKAKQMLDPGHEELKQTGFLSAYRWEPLEGETGDWMVYYWPGRRALNEISGRAFKPKGKPIPELTAADVGPETLELFRQVTLPAEPDSQLSYVWSQVLGVLRDRLPQHTFYPLLSDTILLDLQDEVATIVVPEHNRVAQLDRMYGHLVTALAQVLQRDSKELKIEFVIGQGAEVDSS